MFGCVQAPSIKLATNTPLFQKMAADMDRELLPRLRTLIDKLAAVIAATDGEARAVFTDLRDRVRAYLHWVTSLRNVCAWCECVYGYLDSSDPVAKGAC